jgi:hypothetical protein
LLVRVPRLAASTSWAWSSIEYFCSRKETSSSVASESRIPPVMSWVLSVSALGSSPGRNRRQDILLHCPHDFLVGPPYLLDES